MAKKNNNIVREKLRAIPPAPKVKTNTGTKPSDASPAPPSKPDSTNNSSQNK